MAFNKEHDENPWKDAASKYAIGNIIKGKVARMTDFGAFVEIEPGVDALLHVSQIARDHVDKPSDVLSIGQEIEAQIVDFVEEEKKISISIKQMLKAEDETQEEKKDENIDEDKEKVEEVAETSDKDSSEDIAE